MKVAVATGTTVLGLAAILAVGEPANADPKQFSAFVGTGSDTTQDVVNALAGHANGSNFPPAQSSAATGKVQLTSWDAVGTDCITPKAGGATFLRPNGSSNGRRALSRALDGGTWPASSGLVDFARSSSGVAPGGSGPLTYIPFGRDAVSYGYWVEPGATAVTTLTSAQLTSLHNTGPITVGSTTIYACEIQNGSGTYQFWRDKLAVTDAQIDAATTDCTPTEANNLQENDGAALAAAGAAVAAAQPPATNVQVIVGFSAANFISQTNGVAASQLPAPAGTINLGAIDALGVPYTGSVSGPIAPSATFYASTTYGRDVYNVVSTTRIGPPAGSNQNIKTMFVGPTSGVCSLGSTISAFGFLTIPNCGDTTLQGPLLAN
ncbi:MAG: hypothetical protein ABL966_02030 [Acidimicrobiales bacterium]